MVTAIQEAGESGQSVKGGLPLPGLVELTIGFSVLLSLAEQQTPGHAHRVCYIATRLAEEVRAGPRSLGIIYFGALLHDVGDIDGIQVLNLSAAMLGQSAGLSPEDVQDPELRSLLIRHCTSGGQIIEKLGLLIAVGDAVRFHHERWDGTGFPERRAGEDIPLEARIVAAADATELLLMQGASSLDARRHIDEDLSKLAGGQLDPALVPYLVQVLRSDDFWADLHSDLLRESLVDISSVMELPLRSESGGQVFLRFCEVFAVLADSKGILFRSGHSHRTAQLAARVAGGLRLDPAELYAAGLLHDIGLLAVPSQILLKPDILTLTEMASIRQHPAYAEMALEEVPGLARITKWVLGHHRRPDGHGYPGMSGGDIPLEALVLAAADAYVALTSERPDRRALSHSDAMQVINGGAGTQHDDKVVAVLNALDADIDVSRRLIAPQGA
ncbi:MAG: HD domain-containing phosphohydrolase [Dehalococcoidia bacterium]